MKKEIADKPPLAAWATLARAESGMSVEEVVDALAARGHGLRAASLRGIEGGSKGASARLRRLLADIYGTKAPTGEPVGVGSPDLTELAAALRAQAASIGRLVQLVEAERAEHREWEAGVLESLQALAQALALRGDPAPVRPAVSQR